MGVGGKKGEVSKEERRGERLKREKMGETGKRKVIVNGRGREWLNARRWYRINGKIRERLNGRAEEVKWERGRG